MAEGKAVVKLPSRVEIDSKWKRDAPYADGLSRALNFYFELHVVFQESERLLSGFVNAIALSHVSLERRKRGESGLYLSFSGFGDRERQADAFWIIFTPDALDRNKMRHGEGYIQKGFARGYLFQKVITFSRTESTDPKYLAKALAAVAEFFKAQGWTVKNSNW